MFFKSKDKFIDSLGKTHFLNDKSAKDIRYTANDTFYLTPELVYTRKKKFDGIVKELRKHGLLKYKSVIDFGAGDFIDSFLWSNIAKKVIAIDPFSDYETFAHTKETMFIYTPDLMKNAETVEFQKVDVLKDELSISVDFVFSKSALEHITDLELCLHKLKHLMKENAYFYHRIDTWFHYKGGHSYCSTRIPWGHVILDRQDMARYFELFEPATYNLRMEKYDNFFNKKKYTFEELTNMFKKIYKIIKVGKVYSGVRPNIFQRNKILKMGKRLYPNLKYEDLIIARIDILGKNC